MADNEKSAAENAESQVQEVKAAEATKPSRAKKIGRIALIVLAVLAVILLLVLWQIDRIVATSTRTVGSMLTGTKVDIENVSIRPLAGAVILQGFSVGNPEGFHNPEAIKVGKFHVDLGMTSLFSNKMEIEHLELTGVAIDFEYSFGKGSNLNKILENVEKATGADKKKNEEPQKEEAADEEDEDIDDEEEQPQKQVVIRKLILRDAKVTVSSGALKTTMVIPLIPIEMENVGEGKDIAGTISEVMSRIILEVGNAVTKATGTVVEGTGDAAKAVGGALVSAGEATGDAVNKTIDKSLKFIKKLPGLGK